MTSRADISGSHQGLSESGLERYSWPFLQGMTPIGGDDFGYFSLPIRDFVRAVLRGDQSPMPLDVGLKNVRVIEAAVRSIEGRRAVELALE